MVNNKYNNSCIYKISKDKLIYIGSTCDFNQRMNVHKSICYNINSKSYNLKIYQTIRLNGGWDEFEKVVIKNICCENREELHEIEGEFIKNIGTMNCQISGRTQKQYYENNKYKILENRKQYYENNKDKVKQYYENNKDKIKEYYKNNKDKVKQYYENNKDKVKQYYEKKKKEKIICPICGVFTGKYNIKKHQRSKKCLKFQ